MTYNPRRRVPSPAHSASGDRPATRAVPIERPTPFAEPGGTTAGFQFARRGSAVVNTELPILVLGAVAAAFAVISVLIASLIGPKRYNRAKLQPYECGIEPTPHAVAGGSGNITGQRFPVKYYLTAMLFIIFDIEIVFLYPWAVHIDALGVFGLVAMALFIVNVSVAYAYEWRRGGLSWD